MRASGPEEAAVRLTRSILERMGIPKAAEKDSLHHACLPDNLYVADATILPKAMGNPPILTIMALSKKIAASL